IFTRQTAGMQDQGVERGFTEEGGAGHHDADHPAPAAPSPSRQPANGEAFSDQVLAAASAATGHGTIGAVTQKHAAVPILDVYRTLLWLYSLMWSPERELNQGAPDAALPHHYQALRVIDQLRKAERLVHSRHVRVDPVDVVSARGQGKLDDAAP